MVVDITYSGFPVSTGCPTFSRNRWYLIIANKGGLPSDRCMPIQGALSCEGEARPCDYQMRVKRSCSF